MTKLGDKLFRERQANDGVEDPEARCLPTGTPRRDPYPSKILQLPNLVVILFEGNLHFSTSRAATFHSPPRWAMLKNKLRSPASSDHRICFLSLLIMLKLPVAISCKPRYRPVIFAPVPFSSSLMPVRIASASFSSSTMDTLPFNVRWIDVLEKDFRRVTSLFGSQGRNGVHASRATGRQVVGQNADRHLDSPQVQDSFHFGVRRNSSEPAKR